MAVNLLPIILIHNGNSWYLPYTIFQLKKSNPNTPIYLIGDNTTNHYRALLKHIPISSYEHSTNLLNSVYFHKSSLGKDFEFPCIARWFILQAFMQERNLSQCVYLDSDILVYSDLTEAQAKFPYHGMTWAGFSAHNNFIAEIGILEDFTNNIIDLYTNQFPEELLEKSLFHKIVTNKSKMNISDMTFFHDFNIRYPKTLLDISQPTMQGTFDRSIEDTRGYIGTKDGFKHVIWKSNQPFCIEIEQQREIPFCTLHFQGRGKQVLKAHFKAFSYSFFLFKTYNDFVILLSKLLNKLTPIVKSFRISSK